MPRVIQFEGRQISLPDDASDDEVANVLSQPPQAAAPAPAALPVAPPAPTPDTSAGRNLRIGAQGAGAGLAELAGAPVDLASGALNLASRGANMIPGVNLPQIHKPFLGSEWIKEKAGAASSALGAPPIPQEEMTGGQKLGYNVNRFGAQVAGAVPALARTATTRAAEIAQGSAPKWYDSLVRPYLGESPGRTIAGDAAGAAGAGAGVTVADQAGYQDNPAAQTIAAMLGGFAGAGTLAATEGAARGAARVAGKPFGAGVDRTIPVDPDTMRPVQGKISDRAAGVVQGEAVNPSSARERISENKAALEPHIEKLPSSAALSEDPGLAMVERQISTREPGKNIARQREFNTSVRDTIDRSAPADATPDSLVSHVRGIADNYMSQAQGQVDQARGASRVVDTARRMEGESFLGPHEAPGAATDASGRLDQNIVDRGYLPARAEKNRQFNEAPGRDQQVDATPVIEAAQGIRERVNALGPERVQLPAEFVQRLERLAPDAGGTGTASLGDLVDVRKYLSTAHENARRGGNFDLADNIARLRNTINRVVEESPAMAGANENYRQFAGTYRPAPGDTAAGFTKQIDREVTDTGFAEGRATRSNTPPSQTAGKFLQPQQTEKMASLRRLIDASADPAAGQQAARDYLMADLADTKSGVLKDGVIQPNRLRAWRQRWGNVDAVVPGFDAEIDTMLGSAQHGEGQAARFAGEVRKAEDNLKATQDGIDKGAFGSVMKADPDKAVAAVMSKQHSSRQGLEELIQATEGNPQARNGLKAAVRDYLVDRATTTASEKLVPGDARGPVSFAKLSGVFKEHEKELARVFSPEEMNALRAGHKALELTNVERLRLGTGSDSVEKITVLDRMRGTPLGKGLEAAMRLKFGMLQAGGMMATARRLTSGFTDKSSAEVARLVERAAFDPDLMMLLLGRKIPIASPRWNQKLQTYLAVSEGVRDNLRKEEK